MTTSKKHRSIAGMSLVEMLVTIFVMSLVAITITDIAVTQNVVAFRTFNKLDALTNARRVASFIERDVHNACFIGTQFNQLSGTTLNEQTLILQLPIFYTPSSTGGIPAIPTQTTAPSTVTANGKLLTVNTWNVDTIVYQVVGNAPGQYILQKTVYPGIHNANYEIAPVANAQAILTGIVGPIDLTQPVDPVAGTNKPNIFGYFSNQMPIYSSGYNPGVQPDPSDINGISINLEVFSNASSKRVDLTPKSMAFRTEVYMRGNYYNQ